MAVRIVASTERLTVVLDRQTVRVRGELDLAACLPIRWAIDATRADQPVVFELDTVTFIDSAGLAGLLDATQRPTGARIATKSEVVQWLLEFTDTTDLFTGENEPTGRADQTGASLLWRLKRPHLHDAR